MEKLRAIFLVMTAAVLVLTSASLASAVGDVEVIPAIMNAGDDYAIKLNIFNGDVANNIDRIEINGNNDFLISGCPLKLIDASGEYWLLLTNGAPNFCYYSAENGGIPASTNRTFWGDGVNVVVVPLTMDGELIVKARFSNAVVEPLPANVLVDSGTVSEVGIAFDSEWNNADFEVTLTYTDDTELDTCYYQIGDAVEPMEIDCSGDNVSVITTDVLVDSDVLGSCNDEGENMCLIQAWVEDVAGNTNAADPSEDAASIDYSTPTASLFNPYETNVINADPAKWDSGSRFKLGLSCSDLVSGIPIDDPESDGPDAGIKVYWSRNGIDGWTPINADASVKYDCSTGEIWIKEEAMDVIDNGEGTFYFKVEARDRAWNYGPAALVVLGPMIIDTQGPVVSDTEINPVQLNNGKTWVDGKVVGAKAIVVDMDPYTGGPTGQEIDSCILEVRRFDEVLGADVVMQEASLFKGDGDAWENAAIDLSTLEAFDAYTIWVLCYDSAENLGDNHYPADFDSFAIDRTTPTVKITEPINEGFVYTDWAAPVNGYICDTGAGVNGFDVYLNGELYSEYDFIESNDTGCVDLSDYDLVGDGVWLNDLVEDKTYALEIVAYDALENSNRASLTFTVKKEFIVKGLEQGWNLMSLPLIPENTEVSDVLETGLGDGWEDIVDVVYAYDTVNNEWLWYVPGVEDSTLTEMRDGYGYWIYLNNDVKWFTVRGVQMRSGPILPPEYPVYTGWNLVGFKSTSQMNAYNNDGPGYLNSLVNSWLDVPSLPIVYYPWVGYQTTGIMESGYGYWLHVNDDGFIRPPIQII